MTLTLRAIADLKDLYRGLDRAAAKIRAFQRQTKFVYQTFAMLNQQLMFATAGVVGFGAVLAGQSIKHAAFFEDAEEAFEVIIGDTVRAKALLEDLVDFAATTPFELPEVMVAGRTLLALGVAVDEVVNKLTILGEASTLLGKPVEQLLTGWQRLRAGMFTTAVLGPTGFTREQAAAMGAEFTKAGTMITPGPEATQMFEDYLADMFGGAFEKASQRLSGKIANFNDEVIKAFMQFGVAAAPVTKVIIDRLIELIQYLGEIFKDNSVVIRQAMMPIASIFDTIIDKANEFVDALQRDPNLIKDMINHYVGLIKTLGGLIIVVTVIQAFSGLAIIIATVILAINKMRGVIIALKATILAIKVAIVTNNITWATFSAGLIAILPVILGVAAALAVLTAIIILTTQRQKILQNRVVKARNIYQDARVTLDEYSDAQRKAQLAGTKFATKTTWTTEEIKKLRDEVVELVKVNPQLTAELGYSIDAADDLYTSTGDAITGLNALQDVVNTFSTVSMVQQINQAVTALYNQYDAAITAATPFLDEDEIKKLFGDYQAQWGGIGGVLGDITALQIGAWHTLFRSIGDLGLSIGDIFTGSISAELDTILDEMKIEYGNLSDRIVEIMEPAGPSKKDAPIVPSREDGEDGLPADAKLMEQFLQLILDADIALRSVQDRLSRGLITDAEAEQEALRIQDRRLKRGIKMWSEMTTLNGEYAKGISSQLDMWTNAYLLQERVHALEERRISSTMDIIAHKERMAQLGADELTSLQISLTAIGKRIRVLQEEEGQLQAILALERERQIIQQQMLLVYHNQLIEDQLTLLQHRQRLETISLGSDATHREQLKLQVTHLREQLVLLTHFKTLYESLAKITGNQNYADIAKGMGDQIEAVELDLEIAEAESDQAWDDYTESLAEKTKEFYRTWRQALLGGIQDLIAGAVSGDLAQAWSGFVNTMGSFIQDAIQAQVMAGALTGPQGMILGGLAAGALSLLGGMLSKDKKVVDKEINDVFVVNWPTWMKEPWNLPGSFALSGRGLVVNVNMAGWGMGPSGERGAQQTARHVANAINRGVNMG